MSKVVPVVGGVISGGMNFAAMMPMGKRLAVALDEAKFNYTEEKAREDFETINTVAEEVDECSECVDLENITDVNEDEIKKIDSEECTSDKVVAIEDNEKTIISVKMMKIIRRKSKITVMISLDFSKNRFGYWKWNFKFIWTEQR